MCFLGWLLLPVPAPLLSCLQDELWPQPLATYAGTYLTETQTTIRQSNKHSALNTRSSTAAHLILVVPLNEAIKHELSRIFHKLGPSGPSWSQSSHVWMSVCLSVPSGAVLASHWPWDHMISSWPLSGLPSLPPLETWKLGNSVTRNSELGNLPPKERKKKKNMFASLKGYT